MLADKKASLKALLALGPVIGALALWGGLVLIMGTPHPLMVVNGTSMEPTLEPGDLLLVKAISIEEVRVGPPPHGDIIAFYQPGSRSKIIVHRAVDLVRTPDGEVYVRTKGDNVDTYDPWLVSEEHLIGKVVGRVPLLGYLVEFGRTPPGIALIAIIYGLFLSELLGREEAAIKSRRAEGGGGEGSCSEATPGGS